MIDTKKRTSLKIFSGAAAGAAAIAATPSIASAGTYILGGLHDELVAGEEVAVPVNGGSELTISLSVDPEPTIRLTNNSGKLLIVRHVYPGLIHAGTQTFDINSIFVNCAYAVSAGRSRTIKIQPTLSTAAETQYPRQLYRNRPQRTVTVNGRDHFGERAASTRSFYA